MRFKVSLTYCKELNIFEVEVDYPAYRTNKPYKTVATEEKLRKDLYKPYLPMIDLAKENPGVTIDAG